MRILILGIGYPQADAIKLSKELGLYVISCSNTEIGPGKLLSDEFELVDITDKEKVLDLAYRKEVDFVYSVGSDVAMPTVGYVSEKLGLETFNSLKTYELCNSKDKLRDIFEGSIYSVNTQTIDNKNEKIEMDFPFVMKPTDSQGQRGVKLIHSLEEFENSFDESLSFSREKKVILEEYINGPEISINCFLEDGKLTFCLISDRISWPQFEGGIIHKHIVPSKVLNHELKSKIEQMVLFTCKELNINNGPAYFQVKIQNDNPKLIEVSPRLDGCHMWRLIEFHTGVNLLERTILKLIKKETKGPVVIKDRFTNNLELEFICQPPEETVQDIKIFEEDTLYFESFYNNGEKVRKMNGKMEKVGYLIRQF